jgi:hypothetical protein
MGVPVARSPSGILAGNVGGATSVPTGAGSVLLPSPSAVSVDVGDAVGKLLTLSAALGEAQSRVGLTQANVAEGARNAASAKRKEALEQAAEAGRKAQEEAQKGGLFDDITGNMGVVGLVGLVTFRPDLVITDVAAHHADLTTGRTDLLGLGALASAGPLGYAAEQAFAKYSPDWVKPEDVAAFALAGPLGTVLERGASKLTPDDLEKDVAELVTVRDDDVRVANKIALTAALTAAAATATVLSGGAASATVVALVGIGLSTGTQIAASTGLLTDICGEKAAMWITIGGTVVGAALTLGGSIASSAGAASSLGRAREAIGSGVAIANGADAVVSGTRDLRGAELTRDQDLSDASAEEQKHLLARIERVIDGLLGDLREAKEAPQRASEVLEGVLQTNDQTLLQAGSMKV